MSCVTSYREELRRLGYPSARIDRAFAVYQRTHSEAGPLDRDRILEILLENNEPTDVLDLSEQEQARHYLVHGFIRQSEAERLQIPMVINKMCLPFYGSCFVNDTALSLDEVMALRVGDQVDHRDFAGLFASATVLKREGTRIFLHYDDWTAKWDRWSDGESELFRFAKHDSVSKREGHRLRGLEEGHFVDVNPIHTRPKYKHRHSGWKHAEIKQLCDGQIKLQYKVRGHHKAYLYWVHCDNVDEVAPFTTKSGSVPLGGLGQCPLDSLCDDEAFFASNGFTLSEVFGTDRHALRCCVAREMLGAASRENVDRICRRCDDFAEQNQAAMKRARAMAKYIGGGGGIDNEIHLAIMELADALAVRIKVYTFDEHLSPNNDELITLWADYCGGDAAECPLICLAKIRNAFGILHSQRGHSTTSPESKALEQQRKRALEGADDGEPQRKRRRTARDSSSSSGSFRD